METNLGYTWKIPSSLSNEFWLSSFVVNLRSTSRRGAGSFIKYDLLGSLTNKELKCR